MTPEEWERVGPLIVYQIRELKVATEKNTEALTKLNTQLAVMQVKSSFFGAVGGALSFFLAWGLTYLKGGKP
jgi:hypothetical protein